MRAHRVGERPRSSPIGLEHRRVRFSLLARGRWGDVVSGVTPYSGITGVRREAGPVVPDEPRVNSSVAGSEPASFSEDQWTRLVDLATDVARRTQAARLPDYVFWSPERAGRAEHQALLDYLRRTLTVRT